MQLSALTSESLEHAVGASSATFGAAMHAGVYYAYVANTASWIAQGATPTASAGAGSMYVPANVVVYLDGASGADLATIQDSAGGKASLTHMRSF